MTNALGGDLYLRAETFGGTLEHVAESGGARLAVVAFGERRHAHGIGATGPLGELVTDALRETALLRPGDWLWLTPKTAERAGLLADTDRALTPLWDDWYWMGYTGPTPDLASTSDRTARELDAEADAQAIAACLAEANPTASLQPGDPDVCRWWGYPDTSGAELAGVIAAAQHAEGRLYELHSLGTVPAARGRGVGGALLRRSVAETLAANESLGLRVAILGVFSANTTALAWYRRFGFGEPYARAAFEVARP